MMKKLMIAAVLTGFSVIAVADDGPSIRDVKAAINRTGISVGATVQLGAKSYMLESITVAKAAPDTFVVTFTTK